MDRRFVYKTSNSKNIDAINEIGADGWELVAIYEDTLYWKKNELYAMEDEKYRTKDEEFVYSVFNMFRRIYYSAIDLELDLSDLHLVPHYRGFDNNEENNLFGIARDIRSDNENYSELIRIDLSEGSDNSHQRMREHYEKMLNYLYTLNSFGDLTHEELLKLNGIHEY